MHSLIKISVWSASSPCRHAPMWDPIFFSIHIHIIFDVVKLEVKQQTVGNTGVFPDQQLPVP